VKCHTLGMSIDHHVRSLAGRTVSQSSMLAMQAEAGSGVCVSRFQLASSMFVSSRVGVQDIPRCEEGITVGVQ